MTIRGQIREYIAGQPEPKRAEIQEVHDRILKVMPGCRLWFHDGRNEKGKIVCNPTIGYGFQILEYADGRSREFYQVGVSGNTTGISVYILGIEDKKYLARTYGKKLGKATVTGYCIKFKRLSDIDIKVLASALRDGVRRTSPIVAGRG